MSNREAMIDTIKQAYDARARGDVAGLMVAFHPNTEFDLKGDRNLLPVTGAVRGHENVAATLAALTNAFEFLERKIIDEVAEGDRVAVHSIVKVRFVPKGIEFTTELLDLFEFKDGKIVKLVEFADTALVKSVMGV